MMLYINERQLFEYFIETINSCGNLLLTATDEEIEYNIFEVFDINVHTFFHNENLEILLTNDLITSEVYKKAQLIREMYLKIEGTSLWSLEGIKNTKEWKEIINLCDQIKEKINDR